MTTPDSPRSPAASRARHLLRWTPAASRLLAAGLVPGTPGQHACALAAALLAEVVSAVDALTAARTGR